MADRKKDPLTNFHFYVDIESVFAGTFREVSGLSTENPVIEYWHAGPKGDTRYLKMPGRLKVNDITMKTGTIDDTLSLHKWRKEIEDGNVDKNRKNGTIWMFNQANEPVAKWDFTDAWPIKISGPSLNAGANETAVEELTIAVETLARAL